MISVENILRFLYFLILIFFSFIHLSIKFRLILKKKNFGCPFSTPLYKKEPFLDYLVLFFLTLYWIELAERILLSFFWTLYWIVYSWVTSDKAKHQFLIFSWGRGGRNSDHLPPPRCGECLPSAYSLILKDVPSNFSG